MTYEVALLVFGILLLLVGLAGKVKAKELEVGTSSAVARTVIGVVGLVLVVLSLTLADVPLFSGQPLDNETNADTDTSVSLDDVISGQIRSRSRQEKCLQRQSANWTQGNPIQIWGCGAGATGTETWEYVAETGHIRSLSNRDVCWHKKFGHWNRGNPIHLWSCDAGPSANKSWIYEPETGLIRARENQNMCIHKDEGGFNDGNPIHLWDCNAGTDEFKSWLLR